MGQQTPAAEHVPPAPENDADLAIFLAGEYGLVADEWQRHVLAGWLGHDGGRLTSARCGLAVPRQNGKNALIEILVLFKMVGRGRRVLHTAHEVKTARKAFARLLSFFDNPREYPELTSLVKEIRRTNGQEAIVLRNGGSCEFIARSKSSGRGFSIDDLILDEAQELSEDAMAALVPTLSASPNPQRILTGTPPAPTSVGEVFTRIRTTGLAGKDDRLCWMEWRADLEADPDDPTSVAKANPALGIRLLWDTIGDERADMSEDTFARERLGLWETQASLQVINADLWAKRADRNSKITSQVMFAPDIAPDRQRGSISLAGLRADGRRHIEVAENQRGTAWMAPWLIERVAKWEALGVAIDPGSPAGVLIPDLQKAGIEPILMTQRDVVQACGLIYDYTIDDKVRHLDDPRLNTALAAGRKRFVGDSGGWVWHRKDSTTDITPLVSPTFALWGLESRMSEQKKTLTRVSGRVRSY